MDHRTEGLHDPAKLILPQGGIRFEGSACKDGVGTDNTVSQNVCAVGTLHRIIKMADIGIVRLHSVSLGRIVLQEIHQIGKRFFHEGSVLGQGGDHGGNP